MLKRKSLYHGWLGLYENANPISFILQRRYLEYRSVLPGCSCYLYGFQRIGSDGWRRNQVQYITSYTWTDRSGRGPDAQRSETLPLVGGGASLRNNLRYNGHFRTSTWTKEPSDLLRDTKWYHTRQTADKPKTLISWEYIEGAVPSTPAAHG